MGYLARGSPQSIALDVGSNLMSYFEIFTQEERRDYALLSLITELAAQ